MKVSVVIPTFNSGKTLEKCLKSLRSQTLKPSEIIVVDSFSKDNTVSIAKKYNCKIIQRKSNIAQARNLGVKAAKGEVIVFIDSDCVAGKRTLEELIRPMTEKYEKFVVGSIRINKKDDVAVVFGLNWELQTSAEGYVNTSAAACVAIKDEVFKKVGLFRNVISEDIDFCLRARKKGFRIYRNPKAYVIHLYPYGMLKAFKKWWKYAKGYRYLFLKYPNLFYKAIFIRGLYLLMATGSIFKPSLLIAVFSPTVYYSLKFSKYIKGTRLFKLAFLANLKFLVHSASIFLNWS